MSTTTLVVHDGGTFPAISVTLTSVVRLDSGAPVAFTGSAFTQDSGDAWDYVLTDPVSPVPVYAFTYTILYANGQSDTDTDRSGTGLVDVNVISVANVNVQQASTVPGATISPLQATVAQNRVAQRNITITAHDQTPIVWVCSDNLGNPVNLSGKTVQLVLWHTEDGGQTTITDFTHDNAMLGGITVLGVGNNNAQWSPTSADVAGTVPDQKYNLWNTTDKVGLAAGTVNFLPGVMT